MHTFQRCCLLSPHTLRGEPEARSVALSRSCNASYTPCPAQVMTEAARLEGEVQERVAAAATARARAAKAVVAAEASGRGG